MYLPSRFAAADEQLEEIVRAHPFATLITGAYVSHVPLVLEKRGEAWFLLGHFARANAHWRALESGPTVAVFHGPHAYVTPRWYGEADVPTWNYVVAQLRGCARLLEREADTVRALRALGDHVDPTWYFEIPSDLASPGVLMRSIVGFEIPVETREGKLKLSQNRSSSDQLGVLRGLATRKDEGSRGVLSWMRRYFDKE